MFLKILSRICLINSEDGSMLVTGSEDATARYSSLDFSLKMGNFSVEVS